VASTMVEVSNRKIGISAWLLRVLVEKCYLHVGPKTAHSCKGMFGAIKTLGSVMASESVSVFQFSLRSGSVSALAFASKFESG
jgi:hypothetical protein